MNPVTWGRASAWVAIVALGGSLACARLSRPIATPVELAVPTAVERRSAAHGFPRLALQLQLCCRDAATQSVFSEIAWWDLAIVDTEAVGNLGEYLGPEGLVRRANPNTILLAYFSPADFVADLDLPLYRKYQAEFNNAWLLRDVHGQSVPLYELSPGKWTEAVNLLTPANLMIPEFLNRTVLSSGLVDGVFYDWASTSISWLNRRSLPGSARIDLDGDGKAEADKALDASWRKGYAALLEHSRQVFPPAAIVGGNGGWNTGSDYNGLLNGMMIEQFLEGETQSKEFEWTAVMRTYAHYARNSRKPRLSLVMGNRDNAEDRAFMRFALASTLMFDGYFAFTNRKRPSPAYQQARWYDEYSVDPSTGEAARDRRFKGYLGRPLSEASDLSGTIELGRSLAAGKQCETEVWQRDFEHGRVLLNPTRHTRQVDLGREFRRIRGTVDRSLNDGSLVRTIALPPRTGAIVLRVD